MIKDVAFCEKWEAQTVLSQPADFQQNLRLVEAMYEHARLLGVFPPANRLEGLDDKIRLARRINFLPDLAAHELETLLTPGPSPRDRM
jgi:hypothetical protein